MILYHASDREIVKPDTLHSRKRVDFGAGFYTTPLQEQAVSWCRKFYDRRGQGVLSIYRFQEEACSGFRVMRFEQYSDAWLDFVLNCRRGSDDSDYDIVAGGVANDKVFNTVELFFDGLIDRREAIKRLRYEKPNLQVCFRSQAAIDRCLRFEGSERV